MEWKATKSSGLKTVFSETMPEYKTKTDQMWHVDIYMWEELQPYTVCYQGFYFSSEEMLNNSASNLYFRHGSYFRENSFFKNGNWANSYRYRIFFLFSLHVVMLLGLQLILQAFLCPSVQEHAQWVHKHPPLE